MEKDNVERALRKLKKKIKRLEEKTKGSSRSQSPRYRRYTPSAQIQSRSHRRTRTRSPRTRTRSPRTRTRSERTHTRSPRTRTRSPRTHTRSPRTHTRSPRTHTRSPRTRTRSPRTHDRTPKDRTRSRSRSPHEHPHGQSYGRLLRSPSAHSYRLKEMYDHVVDPSTSKIPDDTEILVTPTETTPPDPLPDQEVQTVSEQIDIDVDILAAMGSVEEEAKIGPPAHNEIVQRWTPILKRGLKKEEKTLLLKDYPPFNNLPAMVPPKLNPELAAAVSEQVKKRDIIIEYRQRNVTAALAAIGCGLECFLMKGNKVEGIKKINDASKILCELIHNETLGRRALIQAVINKELKDSLQGGPDEFLFGIDLTERIRTAKAVQQSAQDLSKVMATRPKTLNSRAPPPRFRRPGFKINNETQQVGGGGKKTAYMPKKRRQPPQRQREWNQNRRK